MKIGYTIPFGEYNWRILEIKGNQALIITEEIVELQWYHNKFVDITWADCTLRNYLNSEFYNKFSKEEKAKIKLIRIENPDSPWFKSKGGKSTNDKIFLLSLKEVSVYFGDSRAKLQNKGKQRWYIDDENNANRQAKYGNEFHSWRLRSPGYYQKTAASVSKFGYIYVRGNGVYGRPRDGGGIRPAMWVMLED